MKKLTILFILLVSTVMFSSSSYAEWTKNSSSGGGTTTFYVNFDEIRNHEGYVYYWVLSDFVKPFTDGELSVKSYMMGDCKIFRVKVLTNIWYKEPMGRGTPDPSPQSEDWEYVPPNSAIGKNLKSVCSR